MSYTKKGPGRRHTITRFKRRITGGGKVFIKGYAGAKYVKKAIKGIIGLKIR